MSLGFDSTENR